jgi:glycosyltransferase involved in cell wall biosynthesis
MMSETVVMTAIPVAIVPNADGRNSAPRTSSEIHQSACVATWPIPTQVSPRSSVEPEGAGGTDAVSGEAVRVLFLYPNDFFGPVMTVYAHLIRGLDPSGFRLQVAVDEDAGGALPDLGQAAVVTRWGFGPGAGHGSLVTRARSSLRAVSTALRVARRARRDRIDVVHASATPYAGTLGWLVARVAGARLLLHAQELVGRYAGGAAHSPTRRRLERLILRRADAIVAVSQFVADAIGGFAGDGMPVTVVGNGVDITRFRPDVDGRAVRREYGVRDDEVLALQLGRILESKRQEDFARAVAIARGNAPRLRGLIVGWEDDRYPLSRLDLERLARELCPDGGLIVADARPDAPELIAACDILVLPSVDDAWGLVLAEAMASGRPVIGSRSGGIPEVVTHGRTGFLVEPLAPDELAARLTELADDPESRARMGAAGRRHAAENLVEPAVARAFTTVYRRLAGR